MSEKELVILQNIKYALDDVGSFDFGDFSYDDVQGLLDLYNKEKEKNKLIAVRIKTKLEIAKANFKNYGKERLENLELVEVGKIGILQELLEEE